MSRRGRATLPGAVAALATLALGFGAAACGSDAATGGPERASGAGADGAGADGSIGGADGGGADGSASGGSSSGGSSSGATTPPTCADDKGCDDGKACTIDQCDAGHCTWTLQADHCLVAGRCHDKGEGDGGCKVCEPALAAYAWSPASDGADCDDGEPCTYKGECKAGGCVGETRICDDGNPCTADVCKKGKGCIYPPIDATQTTPCDDGHACTADDACAEGKCIATRLIDCDDGNPCTKELCDPDKGCQLADEGTQTACDDGDKCTTDDSCEGGKCRPGDKANCDDGNACTIDVCEGFSGCGHLPTQNLCCTGVANKCDDGNPCTTDLCDPQTTQCDSQPNTAVCDDSDACTHKDTCADRKCHGQPVSCDDQSPCTKDACDPAKGCVHSATHDGGACDDGSACTHKDACLAGVCMGEGQCACVPKFSAVAARLSSVQIGAGGKPGEGLNLDGKPTCAPSTNCSDGIDNSLGALAGLANSPLQGAVHKGSLNIAVEFGAYKQGPIELAVHQVTLHKSNPGCDLNKAHCKYTASRSLLDPASCKPKVKLAGKLVGDKFTAGGKGTVFPFSLPIQPGVALQVSIYDLHLQGTVTVAGGKLTMMSGILAGAVPKKDLMDAIAAVPDKDLPIPKATIIAILDSTVEQDMDVNGDGKKDAASIALKIQGIGATLVDAK